jgi:hypothetical protein
VKDGKKNGAGVTVATGHTPTAPPAPKPVADLAEACVRFVERAVGVKLDYQPETLPLLDHYIEQARALVKEKPEMLSVVAQMSGAYFGEVVRRQHASWWRTDDADPSEWRVEFESVFLALCPVGLVLAALLRTSEAGDEGAGDERDERGERGERGEREDEADLAQLTLEEEDRLAVSARLAELPQVSEQEFYALSTRLEVIDIAVEAIRARRLAQGEETEARFSPEDYE